MKTTRRPKILYLLDHAEKSFPRVNRIEENTLGSGQVPNKSQLLGPGEGLPATDIIVDNIDIGLP